MNHRQDKLRKLIRKLYNDTSNPLTLRAIGEHPEVIELAGQKLVRQHIYYYLKNS